MGNIFFIMDVVYAEYGNIILNAEPVSSPAAKDDLSTDDIAILIELIEGAENSLAV